MRGAEYGILGLVGSRQPSSVMNKDIVDAQVANGNVNYTKTMNALTEEQWAALPLKGWDVVAEGAGEAASKGASDDLVNLASPQRTNHILNGDETGGGHLWPGQSGKSSFPQSWNADNTMHNISDIATDPTLPWIKGRVVNGVQRWEVTGVRDGVTVKVITDGKDIITAFPPK